MRPVSLDRINPEAPFAITMGDPAGIGPEIIVKGWTAKEIANTRKMVIGDLDLISSTARTYNPGLLVSGVSSPEEVSEDPNILTVLVPPGTQTIDPVTPGQPSVASGRCHPGPERPALQEVARQPSRGLPAARSADADALAAGPLRGCDLEAGPRPY